MSRRCALTVIALSLLLCASPAAAQETTLERQSVQFTLGNDTYIAGGEVEMDTAVRGDLMMLGGRLTVAAPVSGDVHAAGGTIVLQKDIRDDLRVAGGDITIAANVGGDILILGGRVTIAKNASVGGDVVIRGGSVHIEGRLRGDLSVEATEVTLLGTVDGNVKSRSQRLNLSGPVGRSAVLAAHDWYVGDKAHIAGSLRYWQPGGERDFTGVLRGKATYDASIALRAQEAGPRGIRTSVFAALTLFSLLSGALVVAVLLLLTKTLFRDAARRLRASPGMSALWGLLYFVVTPFVIVLLFATLIGFPLAFVALSFYITSLVLAVPTTAIVLAKWVEQTTGAALHGVTFFLLSIGILVILKLLHIIPFLGPVLLVLAVLSAIGALSSVEWERFKKIR